MLLSVLFITYAATALSEMLCVNPESMIPGEVSVGYELDPPFVIGQRIPLSASEWRSGPGNGYATYMPLTAACIKNETYSSSIKYEVSPDIITVVDRILVLMDIPQGNDPVVTGKFELYDSENSRNLYSSNLNKASGGFAEFAGPIVLQSGSKIEFSLTLETLKWRDNEYLFVGLNKRDEEQGAAYSQQLEPTVRTTVETGFWKGGMKVYAREYNATEYRSGKVCY